jgi:hypothetical protein
MSSQSSCVECKLSPTEEAFLSTLEQLLFLFETRIPKHNDPRDLTRTLEHINEISRVIANVLGSETAREAIDLFQSKMLKFDINLVYRPTKTCNQVDYENERAMAKRLYCRAKTLASVIASTDTMTDEIEWFEH